MQGAHSNRAEVKVRTHNPCVWAADGREVPSSRTVLMNLGVWDGTGERLLKELGCLPWQRLALIIGPDS